MSEVINIKELNERIERESVFVDTLRAEMSKVIVGQSHLVDTLLIGLLSNGHILLEGVPGLAKTLAITTLAKAVDADFSRIQFTPDLLPADLLGTLIYSQKTEDFTVKKGPVFANFVLTAIMMFTIVPTTQKANELITRVCEAIDLELNSGAATGLSNLPARRINSNDTPAITGTSNSLITS